MSTKRFVPLECNPDVFNTLLRNAQVSGYEFHDVFSLDPEMLSFLPRPAIALILALPVSESYESHRLEEDAAVNIPAEDFVDAVWYPQSIDNSCGSMALLHALANSVPRENIGPAYKSLLDATEPLSPQERSDYLTQSTLFAQLHNSCLESGDTVAPAAEDEVGFHYITLTKSKSLQRMVELDGRRRGPLVRGGRIADLLEPSAVAYIQNYINRELASGGNGSFSLIALCASN